MTKYDTRRSCAQKVDSTAIGYHVGDPPNNHFKKKKKILQQNEIGKIYSKLLSVNKSCKGFKI